jgi:hypothetical protein
MFQYIINIFVNLKMQNFGTNGLISDKDFGILSDSASGDDHSLLGRLMHH